MENKKEEKDLSGDEEHESPEDMAKKRKTSAKALVVFIVLVILVFSSVFMYSVYVNNKRPKTLDEMHQENLESKDTDERYVYNGYSFLYLDDLWFTRIQKDNTLFDISLRYGPKQLEDIPIDFDKDLLDPELHPTVAMTINPYTNDSTSQALAASEIGLNLARAVNISPFGACITQDYDACINRPIINCSTLHSEPIIYLKESDLTGIKMKDSCIIVMGKGDDIVRAGDRLIYSLYGIMK